MIKIRKAERIDVFTSELNRIWKTYYLDWRFGQFMMNFLGFVQSKKKRDPFFPEESEMITYLKEYCGEKECVNEKKIILQQESKNLQINCIKRQ